MNTDILWRNETDNAMQIWLMDGNKVADRVPVLRNGNPEFAILPWRIIGLGDFKPFLPPPIVDPVIRLSAVRDQRNFIEVNGTRFTPNRTVKLGYDIIGFSADGPTPHQISEDTFMSDGQGSFVHRIEVHGDISGAQAQATDVASDKTATALLEGS